MPKPPPFTEVLQYLIEELITIPDSETAKTKLRALMKVDVQPEIDALEELLRLYNAAALGGRGEHSDMLAAMIITIATKSIEGLPIDIRTSDIH